MLLINDTSRVGAIMLGAELWGLRQGLKLAKERGWEGIEVESDSKKGLDIINRMKLLKITHNAISLRAVGAYKDKSRLEYGMFLEKQTDALIAWQKLELPNASSMSEF